MASELDEPSAGQLHAAAFLVQALDLEDDPRALAPGLSVLKRDAPAATYAVELDSSIGPTAFLIYAYDLLAFDAKGRTGQELFDIGLATLERAAERDAPGPRLMAHALTSERGFMLATTPETFRVLSGAEEALAETRVVAPGADPLATRRKAAAELNRLLVAADRHARAWLAALEGENGASGGDAAGITFTEEETELALLLLDERSIQALLSVLNLVLTAAREQAEALPAGEPEAEKNGRRH